MLYLLYTNYLGRGEHIMKIEIFLTNLAKYNAGLLRGEWLNLSELTEEELQAAIKKILGKDEEYFITDFEAPFQIDEYDNPYKLRALAEQTKDWSEFQIAGLFYLIEDGNSIEDAMKRVDDLIVYQATDYEALAEQFVDDGLYGEIPESLQYYIDYAKIGNDLSFDYSETEYNGNTYFIDKNY